MDATATELNELFSATFPDGIPKDILGELQSMLRIHSITAEELFYKWESYSIKMGEEVRLNLETVRGFKQDVQEALERETRGKAGRQGEKRSTVAATPRATATTDVFGMYATPLSPIHICDTLANCSSLVQARWVNAQCLEWGKRLGEA